MANTGYKINTYKDVNPYSSFYGNVKTERVLDTSTCPITRYNNIQYIVDIPSDNYTDVNAVVKTYAYNEFGADIIVDWGDGNIESIDYTIKNINHTYISAGNYTVDISVDSFYMNGLNNSIQISSRTSKILSYELEFHTILNRIAYDGLQVLDSIDPSVFKLYRSEDNKHNIGVFMVTPNLTIIQDADWTTIYPDGVDCSSDFSFCTNLVSVSPTLLNTIKPTQLDGFFNYCVNLEMNINDFFQDIDLSEVTNVKSMFEMCGKITGEALPIISRLSHIINVSNFGACFKECTSLSDYSLIPINWKS